MPEGPEVQTVINSIKPHCLGKTIVYFEHSTSLPPKVESKQIVGKTIKEVYRKGKYIVFCLHDGTFLISHLRMTGQWFSDRVQKPDKHLRWSLALSSGDSLIFRDIRKFGTLEHVKSLSDYPGLAKVGFDGFNLSVDDIKVFKDHLSKSSKPIKNVLLDQSVISGIGNIYASEILWHAKIDPRRSASSCVEDAETICLHTMAVLKDAADKGGCSISDYVGGSYHNTLKVYGRSSESCFRCDSKIEAVSLAGRTTFYCGGCQY